MRFLRIEEQKRRWYGGAQEWCEQKYMKKYGCGVIACANVLLHIYQHMSDTVQEDGAGRKHLKWKNSFCMDKDSYMEFVEHLRCAEEMPGGSWKNWGDTQLRWIFCGSGRFLCWKPWGNAAMWRKQLPFVRKQ